MSSKSPVSRDERDMAGSFRSTSWPSSALFKAATSHRMLAFNLPEARKREVHEYLEECALRAKVKLMVSHMKDAALLEQIEEEERALTPEPDYQLILKKFADIEPPPIGQSWIDNIIKTLMLKAAQKQSPLVKLCLAEVKKEYQYNLLKLSVYMKFVSVASEQRIQYLIPLKPDVGGKTFNYATFIGCRKIIENELFLTHPLIRKILSSSKLAIPEVLVNFKNYRKRGWLHLDKLVSLIQSDMKKGEHQICKNWYPKLINMISVKNSLESVPRELWPRFVKCASTVVSVQITQLMQRTINHIIETLSDINSFPQLSVDAYYAGNSIAMIPSEDEIFTSFHRIIDTISYMAQDMPAMEAWFAVPCPNKFISVKRSESFLRNSHETLEKNLWEQFTPVRNYLQSLGDEFHGLSSEKQHSDIQKFLKDNHTFDEMFEKVSYIKTYSKKIKRMVYKEYFSIVRLSQNDIITHLTKVSNGFMFQILQDISLQQINENKKICHDFEVVAERTLHMPVKTKELVEMGSYINYCKTTFMDKTKTKILKSIQLAIQLMDFTSLSDEQLQLNASVVNWLNRIKPIFEEYSDLFENTKYELEERLQRATEKLNKELEDVGPSLSSLSNMDDVAKITDYVQFIQKFLRKLEQFDLTVSWINNEEVLFKFPISTYPELDELKSIVHPFTKLIFTCNKWFRTYKIWMDGAFDKLVLETVDQQVSLFFQELTSTQKIYKTKCKQQATDNYPRRFKGVVDDPDVNNWPAPLKLSSQTLNHINKFKCHLRLIGIVCNSALRKRHWKDLSDIAGFDVTPNAGTTLRKFIGYQLEHLLDQFEVVSVSACKELQLYQTLCVMKAEWTDVFFTSTTHLETKVHVLCDVENILTLVDNHLMKCISIRGSAFVKPLTDEMNKWCDKLEHLNCTIETWLKVEKQWLDFYLVFTSETIRGHMPTEVLLYQEVDKQYQELIEKVGKGSLVIMTAGDPKLLRSLLEMMTNLETINVGVKVYLNKLRMYFPRLFFLSNNEVLQMLAETKPLELIFLPLEKIFMGIKDLDYDLSSEEVIGMKGADGEIINFEQPLQAINFVGSTEKLLSEIEKQMKVSMKVQCKKCLNMYKKESFGEWVVGWPGQAVQCALMTVRTGQIHNCLVQQNSQQLQFVFNNIRSQKEVLFSLVQEILPARVRLSLEALIILTVHFMDFLQLILGSQTICDTEFNWVVQLRYYQQDSVQIRMLNASLPYAYEYIGNTFRLVMTPLTERCFRTLVGSYHLNLHGAPEGLPGTGKSETVRDLAKAVAVYCFSFSCTADLSHYAIEKFLQGIANARVWSCFINLHNVKQAVLSVMAQQLTSITTAICVEPQPTFSPHCYICVTLCPDLSIQTAMPDNLKMLFRPVAMMFPDMQTIAEVCLYSYGFANSHKLSFKLVNLKALCSKQLSHQGRFCCASGSLKAVLKVARNLKQSKNFGNEEEIFLQAIKDIFNPMMTEEDMQVLNSILSELFVNVVDLYSGTQNQLISAATLVCKDMALNCGEMFLSKVVQIYDAIEKYAGVILVGPPFSGKTTALQVVKKILTIHEEGVSKLATSIINPMTLSISQLYGYTNDETHEWFDGIVTRILREVKSKQWLVMDGPMDSSWLDTLNTVFDTTRQLCLSSGEIISMSTNTSVVFETMHLDNASPATVSRCGVIYTPPHTICWRGLVYSWLSSSYDFLSAYTSNYNTLFEWIIPPTLVFVETKCNSVMKASQYNMFRTMLLLIEMMLKDACGENEDYAKHLPTWIQSATFLGGVWGFGGPLTADSRELFDAFFRDIWRGNIEDHPMPESIEKLEINIPSEGQLNEYWYHFKGKGAWRFWPEVVRSLKIEEDIPNLQLAMVSTVESANITEDHLSYFARVAKCRIKRHHQRVETQIRYLNILELNLKNQSSVLLVGPTATGKTFYINKIVNKLPLEKYLPISIPFSSKMSTNFFQEFLISKMERKSKEIYRAPEGMKAVLFVDDLNMPEVDHVGVQPPLEVLHQFLDHGLWFRSKNNSLVNVEDLLLLSACGVPDGHKKHICPRILRHFSLFALSPLSDESVTKIYSTLLFTGFKRNGFSTDVMPTVMSIVGATADLLSWVTQNLCHTPKKPHYIFSMRDYAKLILSHLLVKRENVDSKKVFIRLWIHEALRVFSDRLVEREDRVQLIHRIRFAVKEYFKESFDASLDNLMPKDNEEIEEEHLRDLIFTTVLTPESSEERKYEEVGSLQQLQKSLTAIIELHNSTQTSQINVVLFRFALEHLCRLCRVLSLSGGSCVLLGMRGSGRQTLTQLAAILCKALFFQPSMKYNYGFAEWRTDLKQVLIQAGGNNSKTVYYISENELKNELFLQDIDMILSTGQIPDLFSTSEREDIFEMVRLAAQGGNRNLDINPLSVFSFFISRCRQNLHIVISSILNSFRKWISVYPSLFNYCTIDWVEPYNAMVFNGKEYKLKDWPEEALEKIAFHCWEGLKIPESVKTSAIVLCKYIHVTARDATDHFNSVSGRKYYVTSASYLIMVKKYRSLFTKKQEEITEIKAKFICGLEKLELATSQVSVIQKELEALQPQLQVAAEETANMMEVIDRETVTVDEASGLVRVDEHVAKTQAAAANNLKTECEADLALAIPILEEAVAALNTLKPTDITLVKSMKNPPDTVKLVMAAVCVMKDIKPEKIPDPNTPGRKILDYWGPSKRLLGDMAFLQQLKDYDKDNIPPPIMSMIRKQYLPNKDFKPHIVAKASSAAEGLCKWVIAMDMYDAVAKEVAPKKVKLEIAEREFAATMAVLEEKRAQVRMLEEKLMDLNAKLDAAQQRKMVLENEVRICKDKLWKAQKLIGGLAGEKERWKCSVDTLQSSFDNLPGNILVSCGFIAYLAPLTSPFRISLIEDWCKICRDLKIPISDEFNFIKVLGFDMNIQNWNILGLPKDEFSIENAVILEYTNRCPLLIDPQGLAISWIKAKEKASGLQVVKLSDDEYMKTVEASLDAGNPILLENVGEELNSIVLSPFLVRGSMGNTDKRQNIYMSTSLHNPVFSPSVYNNFSVINFTLTLSGLEDILLDIVVAKERPDLQERKQSMFLSSSENKNKLKEIENRILETLSYTKGNILENENAINILETAKILLVDIKEKQKEFKLIEEEIYTYCQQYFAVVEHSARLFFCLTNLNNINYMYQFSLNWFLKTYTTSIETANRSQVVEVRLQYLEEKITYNLFKNICRSLIEKHRILFSLLLCTTIELANKTVQEDDLNYLLYGSEIEESISYNPASDWLPESAWIQICSLNKMSAYAGFRNHFEKNHAEWKDLRDTKKKKFPPPWDSQLSSFQKLNLIKIIFPDEMTEWILEYIEESMGPKYATLPSLDISSSFEESNCLTPLLFILSPGTDPVASLHQFARSKQIHLHTLSLGVAQDEAANVLIKQCKEEGSWVCLENCHLDQKYMSLLEKLCDSLTLHNTSMEFRLWLTCKPTSQFPISILQRSVKMATDLSSGLKKRMMHSYLSEPVLDDNFFYGCPGKDRAFAKLLYSISFLHAFVLERKKYRYLGWNYPYEFTQVDFNTSLYQLQMYINDSKDIPYSILQYVIGECNYGGRVHDLWDHRLLTTLVTDMINIQVTDSPDYRLSNVSEKFQVPLRFEYHDFIVSIQELPDDSTSEVFGLNYNAEIQHNISVTQEIFETLKMLQPNPRKEKLVLDKSTFCTVEDILQKLPEKVETLVQTQTQCEGSLGLVLMQETVLYTCLLHTIISSLHTFKGALLGLSEPPEDFEQMGLQLKKHEIPSSWLKKSFPTCKKLGSFIDDLVNRLEFLKTCQQEGYQQEVWLPGLFSPQSLLTASLQKHSLMTNQHFHQLTFDHIVLSIESPSENLDKSGLIASGLYIQGAMWDLSLSCLGEQPVRKFYSNMPKIWFKPCLKKELYKESRYICPLYYTAARDDYITQVMLPSELTPSHWIYRGVILFCQEELN